MSFWMLMMWILPTAQNHPRGGRLLHTIFSDGTAVFLSLDTEIGGEYVGITQLSAEIVRMMLVAGRGVAQDRVEDVTKAATFDSYVKPANACW